MFALASLAAAQPPQLVFEDGRHRLLVDGEPFLMLGAQVHNSSAWASELETVWAQLEQLGGNTLEVPIYWHEVEPEEGSFRFETVDAIVEGARAHGVRLVLLWFGTWKNGTMDYVPSWVKDQPERFPRMVDRGGQPVRVLSPHAESNLEADKRAFAAFMKHLRSIDNERYTVIMVQVQNEPGSLFTVRDFSKQAQKLFDSSVPSSLRKLLDTGKGTWSEVFGSDADETFAAWSVATYVNEVARAGRAEYTLPLSVNVWLRERKSWERPGEEYPSGGATSNMLDLWKAVATEIDVIAPDIYVRDVAGYRAVCESYSRPDNALLIPETFGGTSSARYLFHAIGNSDALGFAPFGFNRRDGNTELVEIYRPVADSYRLLADIAPLLDRLRGRTSASGSRRLQAAIEEDQITQARLEFEGWDVLVQWGEIRRSYGGEFPAGTPERSGRALVAQNGADEFFVAGFDSLVNFRPARDRAESKAMFLTVEEGTFVEGEWKAQRALNGDQVFFGLRLRSHGTLLRVVVRPL